MTHCRTSTKIPLVVGIGGTIGAVSSTGRALKIALDAAELPGFRTRLFGAEWLGRDRRNGGRHPAPVVKLFRVSQ